MVYIQKRRNSRMSADIELLPLTMGANGMNALSIQTGGKKETHAKQKVRKLEKIFNEIGLATGSNIKCKKLSPIDTTVLVKKVGIQ